MYRSPEDENASAGVRRLLPSTAEKKQPPDFRFPGKAELASSGARELCFVGKRPKLSNRRINGSQPVIGLQKPGAKMEILV
jgi:hypothetical protein